MDEKPYQLMRHTPKHGSGLNIAEIELNVMSSQSLSRRIGDSTSLREKLSAWETRRNEPTRSSVDWHLLQRMRG
jgi:DNA-binding transcriptional regulator YiaG